MNRRKIKIPYLSIVCIVFLISFFSQKSRAETDPFILYSKLTSADSFENALGSCHWLADVWAYQLQKSNFKRVSKILILYTNDFSVRHWNFHVAPMLKINGQWIVFERANNISSPLTLLEWMQHINFGNFCKIESVIPKRLLPGFQNTFSIKDNEKAHSWYDARKSNGECAAFILEDDFYEPSTGFLNFVPQQKVDLPSKLNRKRAIESCKKLSLTNGQCEEISRW